LKDHGAREIFGIPGDFVLPFFKVIEDSGILPHYTLSHEPGVGFRRRCRGALPPRLGVAVVTFGRGRVQPGQRRRRRLCRALAGRRHRRAPGRARARQRLRVHHQARSIDTQMAVYREITCDQAVLTDADTAPAEIARVLRTRASARCRSISSCPRDMAAAPTAPFPCCRGARPIPTRSPNAPRRSSRKLADARRP
jgi:indolepyruvate decarboxylase